MNGTYHNISLLAECQINGITVLQGFCKIIPDVQDHIILIHPDTIFKMQIKASVIQIYGSYDAYLVITDKRFCM